MRLLALILPICLCAFVTIAQGKSVTTENKNAEDNQVETEHDTFFKRLTAEEKGWLMHQAVWYDMDNRKPGEIPEIEQPDVPEIEEPSPIGYSNTKSDEFVPFPIPDETPEALLTGMLNGQIPGGWQKRFNMWLRSRYNLTSYNFNYYKNHRTFCPPQHANCPGFGDIGAECCPFG